jgi:hypothetical protein
MTSDCDDLEEALRQNLKPRRELAAEVAKAKGGGITLPLGFAAFSPGRKLGSSASSCMSGAMHAAGLERLRLTNFLRKGS